MVEISNLKQNLLLQMFFHILEIGLPLITSPYISRKLGATQLGVFSYTSSIVAYFVLFAMLGTYNYGTRCIAEYRDDYYNRSKAFSEIYFLQLLCAVTLLIAYIVYLFVFSVENFYIACIQILAIIPCFFDVNWLFSGLELFKITVGYNTIIRIATVIAIIALVNTDQDLDTYIIIMLLSNIVARIVLWKHVFEYVTIVKISLKDIVFHFKPNIKLFFPLLAMSIYHIMDKTMLGSLSTYQQCGYYYNADKLINIPIGIISGISTVVLPRMTRLIKKLKIEEANRLFCRSLEGTILIASAMAFGIAAISRDFVPLFFGDGYEECIFLTVVLAPVLLIKAFAFTARYQYLIPHHLESEYTASIIVGAISNLILNLYLIPKFGALGAVIATLVAEFVACLWQYRVVIHRINLGNSLFRCMLYLANGCGMFFVVRICLYLFDFNVYINLLLEMLLGAAVYTCVVIVLIKYTSFVAVEEVFGQNVIGRIRNGERK